MLILLAALFAHSEALHADWQQCRSGPFEIWTDGFERQARQLLVRLEQLRHVFGTWTAKDDPISVWPIRVLLVKDKRAVPGWKLGRESWLGVLPAGAAPPPHWQREIARFLLESNLRRMPQAWEEGLLDLASTVQADGPKVTVGAPPPQPTRNWARVQFFATSPEYATRLRVLINNLQQGAGEETAYKNAFSAPPSQLEAEIDNYYRAGKFTPVTFSGRPLNERDFYLRPLDEGPVMAALVDAGLQSAPLPAGSLEAAEALGLAAAASGNKSQALEWLRQACASSSKSARVWLAYGHLLDNPDHQRQAFVEAAKRNPRWAQPYIELANLESNPERQAFYLKTAAALDFRNSELWQRLGKAQLEARQFSEASKSWFAAELAAPDETAREAIRQARRRFEEDRAEREAAERRRVAEQKRREIEQLKEKALAEIRAAEARANANLQPLDPNRKVEAWWEDPQPSKKLQGLLSRVDCQGGAARLWIQAPEGARVALLIPNSGQVVHLGNSQGELPCGLLKPPRQVAVEYKPRTDSKYATAGDVVLIEFR